MHINHYWNFKRVTTKYYKSLYQTKFIPNFIEFFRITNKQCHTLFIKFLSNNTGTFRNKLQQNATLFYRSSHQSIKKVTVKYCTLFWEFISYTDIFREVILSDTTYFFRFHIKPYWHFQRANTKQYYKVWLLFENSYHKFLHNIFREIETILFFEI